MPNTPNMPEENEQSKSIEPDGEKLPWWKRGLNTYRRGSCSSCDWNSRSCFGYGCYCVFSFSI
jgi:hypothetical protein